MKLDEDEIVRLLTGLNFSAEPTGTSLMVTPPSARLDIRPGASGRADVIEEIARLHGYGTIARHVPSWPEPGGLSARQVLRRHLREIVVNLGALEVWTPTLISEANFDLAHSQVPRVRITNPLAADESILRATMVTGMLEAWSRNAERGVGDVVVGEFGTVFVHPDATKEPRVQRRCWWFRVARVASGK